MEPPRKLNDAVLNIKTLDNSAAILHVELDGMSESNPFLVD